MALTPGTRLGLYDITALIGEGGMGQVYCARDTKLGRDVALKILPDAVAHDADRLARFKREAQVLAALNHPHIAAIYGFDEAPSTSSGRAGVTQFLVLELVDGETLADRLRRGPIAVDETIAIARQMAEALEEAHEKGIIHRDLKPANVAFTAKDQVKVLDFGLAKLAATPAAAAASSASMSPTLTTPAMTAMGMILGTAAYMAPEQAKGREADKRSDLWAFGCVVFEMLTATRAFAGEDITDTIASIMRGEPDWKKLPTETPANLRQLLELCLTKDRRRRAADIAVAQFLLGERVANRTNPESPIPNPVSAWRHPLPIAVTAAALAAAAVVILWAPWRSEKPVDRPLVRLDVDLGADAAFPSANNLGGSSIAISPDGTRLVYGSGTPSRLFTRRLDQPKATELPGTEGAIFPFFSPDGQWVGFFFFGTGKVNKISVEGGAVVPIGEVGTLAGASWGEDGSIVVSEAFGKGLLQFPAAGGSPRILAPLGSDEGALALPQFLPGGKAILFAACALGAVSNCNIEVLTLADGRRKILARGGGSPSYLASSNGTGHLVYLNKATLFAIPFDPATLETRGTAMPVLDDVAYAGPIGAGLFGVSGTGTLIYRRSRVDPAALTTVQWVDSSGKKESLLAKPGPYQWVTIFPDGKRILLGIDEGPNQDIWVYDSQRDALTRLTSGGINMSPVSSPDGQYVVFAKIGMGIFQSRADGASQPQVLTENSAIQSPVSFTPDGKRLAYHEGAGRNPQIWTVPLEDRGGHLKAGKPEQFLNSTFADLAPSFSPDGRWLAYHSNESGKNEVYVRAFPPPSSGQGGKWQVSNNGGAGPQWSRTGHELVYHSGNQLMTVGYSVKGDTFVAEKPRVWIAALGSTMWDLAPDGKRVAVVIAEGAVQASAPEHEIVMLLNFADELRRRVPPGK